MSEAVGNGWTVAHIPWQIGRRALITGANSGIGYYTALELARKGAHALLACRDKTRGEAALARIRAEVHAASAEVVPLDLASLTSVRACAEAELALGVPLDLLINNAGVYAPKTRQQTADGFELQFGTNVLGHFALTGAAAAGAETGGGEPAAEAASGDAGLYRTQAGTAQLRRSAIAEELQSVGFVWAVEAGRPDVRV